ncbi:hypothetical protein TA3x_005855 (plasmid) [Tundrisphaera sp. TA3]|uniref:hypothetical protein n=1 Tax=Tundrisphaera sp. TA3 TaxID=3435775 RepID=UPI003EBD1809
MAVRVGVRVLEDVAMDVIGDAAMDAIGDAGVDAVEPKGKSSRPRKRPSAKVETGRRSLNLRVDEAVYEKLTIHAMKRHMTISDLVGELATNGLRDYGIHRLGQRGGGSGEA